MTEVVFLFFEFPDGTKEERWFQQIAPPLPEIGDLVAFEDKGQNYRVLGRRFDFLQSKTHKYSSVTFDMGIVAPNSARA